MSRNFITIFFLSIACLFGVVSCENDNESIDPDNPDGGAQSNQNVIGSWASDKKPTQHIFTFLEDGTGYLRKIRRNQETETYVYTYQFNWSDSTLLFDEEFDRKYTEWLRDESNMLESTWKVAMRLGMQMTLTHNWTYTLDYDPEIREDEDIFPLFKLDSIMPL